MNKTPLLPCLLFFFIAFYIDGCDLNVAKDEGVPSNSPTMPQKDKVKDISSLGNKNMANPPVKPRESGYNKFTPSRNPSMDGMVLIPSGRFIMGSDEEDNTHTAFKVGTTKLWFKDEQPKREIYLPAYYIDRFEVTNAQYKNFDIQHTSSPELANYPAVNVNWFEAEEYCNWMGKRLPTEEEWEKAARGIDGRQFPWGNEFKNNTGNTAILKKTGPTPVGSFSEGKSPYGVYDLIGNVSEWTNSWYTQYKGSKYFHEDFGEWYRVVRGNSWIMIGNEFHSHYYRASYRNYLDPSFRFIDTGFRCVKSLEGDNEYDIEIDMILIPKGEFIMGSNKVDTENKGAKIGTRHPLFVDEHPERKKYLPAYYIDKYEVTKEDYWRFNPSFSFKKEEARYPVVNLNWFEAQQFCFWRGKTLPTEAEWEKAARGIDGREYPWGNEFDKTKANIDIGNATLVGSFLGGVSPFGVYDMAGNVWEWTSDWYKQYKGGDYVTPDFGEKYKVARGGSRGGLGHYNLSIFFRSAHRLPLPPDNRAEDTGFRCVKQL